MKCFYHKSDLDGWCSAAIVSYKFPEVALIGIDYGEDFPWPLLKADEEVFMVDFSLQPYNFMLELAGKCNLTWIDHHISAILDYEFYHLPGSSVVLDPKRAACELCWDYLFLDEPMPLAVQLLGRYDVWDHEEEQVLPFQYGMRMRASDPSKSMSFWDQVFTEFPNSILHDGATILVYTQRENEKYVEATSFELDFEGLRFIVSNAQLTGAKLFDVKWNPDQYDAMLVFGWRKGQWNVSMYSDKEGIDVSRIAVKYGGGGHAGACGFQCDELPFELI